MSDVRQHGGKKRRGLAASNGAGSPPSRLSEGQVIAAARELIRELGVDGCTMRALSTRLGVALGATYHYVPNKQRLLALVGRDVYREIAEGLPADGDWKARLRATMVRTVELFGQYPGLAAHVMAHGADIPPQDPNLVIYTMLQEAGFTGEAAGELMGSLFLFVGGMCISAPAFADVGVVATADLLGTEVLTDDFRRVFEAGLDMLLDGAELRLGRRPRGARRSSRRRSL